MQYRLRTIFYTMTLVAASLALCGGWGVLVAAWVLFLWYRILQSESIKKLLVNIALVALSLLIVKELQPQYAVARKEANHNACKNGLQQIALALKSYSNKYGSLPPAYLADENGKPMHSWRVLLLPFLGEQSFYDAYSFDEPWNGPNNSKLQSTWPNGIYTFACPGSPESPDETDYFVIAGPVTAWPGAESVPLSDIKDGCEKTLLVIEVVSMRINWMEPRDFSFAEAIKLLGPEAKGESSAHRWTRGAITADFRTWQIGSWRSPEGAKALLTIAANDKAVDIANSYDLPRLVKESKKIYVVTTFIFVLAVPLPWAIKKHRATFEVLPNPFMPK